jgi:tripartite-type tricarboxylate transporter receptor subunit TctC
MAIDSTLVMNQYLYKALPYDPLGDFVPITLTAKTVSVLAVAAAAGPITVTDLTPERRRNRASSIMAPAPLRRS